jgi:flagellar biosynthetic protein FliR
MRAEQVELLWAFSACFARMSGALVATPIPGWRNCPKEVRAFLALILTIAFYPVWPQPTKTTSVQTIEWIGLIATELAIGLILSCSVAFLLESFSLAAQLFGLQAGFSYASTIDPNSEADSGVLQVVLQLFGGLVFLALGFDRLLLLSLAQSFATFPPGVWPTQAMRIDMFVLLGVEMWRFALRIAIPIGVLLMILDLTLALINRLQVHLQLLTLAFPIKLLVTLVALAALLPTLPDTIRQRVMLLLPNLTP